MSYEVWEVAEGTLGDVRKMEQVESCSFELHEAVDTVASGTIEAGATSARYARVYEVRNGIRRKPLGTFAISSAGHDYEYRETASLDAFGVLQPLSRKYPPIGYYVPKGANVAEEVASVVMANTYAAVRIDAPAIVTASDFVAELEETWLSFASGLLASAGLGLREEPNGSVTIYEKGLASISHRFADGDGSALAGLSVSDDSDSAPNGVEVMLSTESGYITATSGNVKGREANVVRITSPDVSDGATAAELQRFADDELRKQRTKPRKVSIRHVPTDGVFIGAYVAVAMKGAERGVGRVSSQSYECGDAVIVTSTIEMLEA